MKVSVVIPTHNREAYLPRAIDSIINQNTNKILEIIIVDDASTDQTANLIGRLQLSSDIPIKYLRNIKSLGGAVARNQGSREAKGEFIAFLDSDDEWCPNHIESGLKILNSKKVKGLFSNFIISSNNVNEERKLAKKEQNMRMGDYLLSNNGDTRTSTFLFIKEYFEKIEFDENLKKHQDWDLAIRFDESFGIELNPETTVIMYSDVDNRMSNTNNHVASNMFIKKHYKKLSSTSIATFYTNLAVIELRNNGKNDKFKEYIRIARKHSKVNNVKINIKILSMSIPFINFVKLYDYLIGKRNILIK